MKKISYRSISTSVILSVIFLLLFSLILSFQPVQAQPSAISYFTIGNYQLISSKRISSTVWEYTYRADITNGGSETGFGVTAMVTSLVSTAKVIQDTLHFNNVGPHETKASLDFFILQIDRRYPLRDSDLRWTINSVNCEPPDECHSFSSWDPVRGCIFVDKRTTLNTSPNVQRLTLRSTDGHVNLYYNNIQCTPWVGYWVQALEPENNYCGPTVGMNLLHWYTGTVPGYSQLGSEMKTNNWFSNSELVTGCMCVCSPCPSCFCPEPACVAACYLCANHFVDVGTHPDNLESTLSNHSPDGYRLIRSEGNPGLDTVEGILQGGNPIAVLIWTGSTLHWTIVTGTYDQNGTTMVRFANYGDQTWDWFVHQWSFEGLNFPAGEILSWHGIEPYTWMRYVEVNQMHAGHVIAQGAANGISSEDRRFLLTLSNGALYLWYMPQPWIIQLIWNSSTPGSGARVAVMQADGNFVLYNSGGEPVWATNTAGHPGAYLAVQNDGNVVIYDRDNTTVLWETGTCCR